MRERNELEGMLHDAAGRLSPAHVVALVAQPEADRRLSARARGGAPERLLTSEELAARTGLRTRQTV